MEERRRKKMADRLDFTKIRKERHEILERIADDLKEDFERLAEVIECLR